MTDWFNEDELSNYVTEDQEDLNRLIESILALRRKDERPDNERTILSNERM